MVRSLPALVALVVIAAAAIAFALRVTPMQTVSALGETVQVGVASPTLSTSGPGVVDVFGQSLPTELTFTGPVRPRLVLTRITINRQVADFLSSQDRASGERLLGRTLSAGWTRYFAWEMAFVALGAVVLGAAYVGLRRRSLRRSLAVLVVTLVVAEGANLGWVMLTAYSAPKLLSQVHSLTQLVGRSDQPPDPSVAGPPQRGVQAVVLGDSTAAGLGNPPLSRPTHLDQACHRSADAYGVSVAAVNGWRVEDLACSGATIPAGILGPQRLGGGVVAPAQLSIAKRAVDAKAVFLSVGADDLQWDVLVRLCAGAPSCNDAAFAAYFQSKLHQFATDYYRLLEQLAALPNHPAVVVNQYYNPFAANLHCLAHVGLTTDKVRTLVQRLDALNSLLAKGAKASGFATVQPDFAGHQLCTKQPYVQGLHAAAPFHPTASGELAIALADEEALSRVKTTGR